MQESMQDPNATHDRSATPSGTVVPRRIIVVLAAVLALLLLILLPPYINVSRYRRRVDRNIGAALGRPVHFDNLSLVLLPFPGFTLQNFVVDEDPAFGSEPTLRADEVHASLRLASLWGRRVEFSRISLTNPSVNLVRTADGRWDIENLLLQASQTQAAPTAQRFAGASPRFPYIEATSARLNFKLGLEKTPISLTEADFALWLPQPRQWRLRLEAHPVRTDTGPADTGTLRIEATLGAPETAAANTQTGPLADTFANFTIDLQGEWRNVQLGGLSRLVAARDAGLRGELDLNVNLIGTLDRTAIASVLQLTNARRADFVPPHLLAIEADCRAIAHNAFHAFSNVECNWPPSRSSGPRLLALTANVPDIRQPRASSATLTLPNIPADTFLDWLSVAMPRPPTGLTGPGTLAGAIAWNADAQASSSPAPTSALLSPTARRRAARQRNLPPPQPAWSGEIEFSNELLQLPALGSKPIPLGALLLHSSQPPATHSHSRLSPNADARSADAIGFDLLPIALPLGGKQPATLDGHFDATGYTLHLTGYVLPDRLLALGDAIPQLGDGLRQVLEPPSPQTASQPLIPSKAPSAPSISPGQSNSTAAVLPPQPLGSERQPTADPVHIDLTATRAWGGPQSWRQTTPPRHSNSPPTPRNSR